MSIQYRKLTKEDASDLRNIINKFINQYYFVHQENIIKHDTHEFHIYINSLRLACSIINPDLAKNFQNEPDACGSIEIYFHLHNPNPKIRLPPQSIQHFIPDEGIGFIIRISFPNNLVFAGDYKPEKQKIVTPLGGGLYSISG